MKKVKLVFGLLIGLAMATTSCSSDDNDDGNKNNNQRFESEFVGDMAMEILTDNETDLVWVNDNQGCFAGIVNPTTQCAGLTFAGQSDWRIPTADEMTELISEIAERKMNLNYINSSCSLMSTSDTIWVFTENSNSPGDITMNKPGNAGLRCVRDKK